MLDVGKLRVRTWTTFELIFYNTIEPHKKDLMQIKHLSKRVQDVTLSFSQKTWIILFS